MFIWLVENVYQVHFETTGQKHTTCINNLGFWVILRFNFNSTVDRFFEILPSLHSKSNSKPFPAESFSDKLQEPSFLRKLSKRSNKKRCWREDYIQQKGKNGWTINIFRATFCLNCFVTYKKKQNHILGKGNHDIMIKAILQTSHLIYNTCSVLHWGLSRGRQHAPYQWASEQLRSGLLSKDYVLLRAGPNKKLQMQDWSSKPQFMPKL